MSMPLAGLLFWLSMTAAACVIWRSGDRIGGRSLLFAAGISGVGATGTWLVSVGFDWPGYALMALAVVAWVVVLWRIDRADLRASAPVLVLGGAVIAVIWTTEFASWMGAAREVVLGLLVLLTMLTAAFVASMLITTARLLRADLQRR